MRRAALLNLSSGATARTALCGAHAFMHPSFDVQEFHFAEPREQVLERCVAVLTKAGDYPSRLAPDAVDRGGRTAQSPPSKFRRRVGALVAQQPRQYMGVRALWALAVRRRYRLIDFDASDRLTNTRCGLAAEITPIAPLPGSNSDRPVHFFSAATTSASPVRMHALTCNVPSPRSNRTAERSCARSASASGPISVKTVRWSIAQMSSGRHKATRWLQLCVVSDFEATGRILSCAAIRKPPRAVTAEIEPPVR